MENPMGCAITIIKGRNAGPATFRRMEGKATIIADTPDCAGWRILLSSLDERSRLSILAFQAGVTLEWLLEDLTMPEARAWLTS